MPLPSAYRRAPLMDTVYVSLPVFQRAPAFGALRDRLLSMAPADGSLAARVLQAELSDLTGALPAMPDLAALPLTPEAPEAYVSTLCAAERLAFHLRDTEAARAVGEAFVRFHEVLPRIPEARVFACAAPLLRAMVDFYRRSGDRRVLALADTLRGRLPDVRGFCRAFPLTDPFRADPVAPEDYNARMGRFADGRGLADTFAMCAALAQFTGSEYDLTAPADGLKAALRHHGLPVGCYSAMPALAGKSPACSASLEAVCALTEALCDALRLTGESFFANQLELLAANALPELIRPDGVRRSVTPNRLTTPETFLPEESEWIALASAVQALRDTQFAMADDSSVGVLLPLSGECRFKAGGVPVTLTCEARGYWRRQLTVTVSCEEPAAFTLRLRVPVYADGAQISLNGGEAQIAPTGQYASIKRTFRGGDTIALQMMLSPRAEKGYHNAVSLFCGETLLSLPLPQTGCEWRYALASGEPAEGAHRDGLASAAVAAVAAPSWQNPGVPPQDIRDLDERFTLTLMPAAAMDARVSVLPEAK